ncbi:hypothetical protein HBH56_038060 [Parastagonospora nodorum]|uniref:Uncharacterized protein n=1 Tax=Phaeosphaeria nodorum (strain SN15 / ATCC MYA-4574 / FGSC 10173) TaxID=321614 RepID=A0A7U2F783_PHANO|nr:hypothetical protein HBH56_038060 [Parastagonospora nodorum]QRC99896.1 hypothetical protein JI435_068260 [Parastagonospora nodorum SN15]KAH3933685.1 hypothetical protein HBH54_061400 [Parastagonospora nodorum]KAH3979903.1 hypothetical protein HBH51_059720 [Parastagonospora nodorum]KAH3980448.1 hypothetical protein HBH52_095860 [Parastagonospora nodorum]
MPFSRSFTLAAIAALLSSVMADANAICYSYGVDFVDEGNYFINSQLSEQFSSVSYFKGCNQDVADVLLVEPEGVNSQEYLCDQMTTYPNDDLKTSTCPIRKNQMISGHWRLLVLGNNGDEGQPFAWQRDLYLTVGTPVTATFTPTVTFSMTSTPVETQTTTTTFTNVVTTGPLSTVTLPSGTAKNTKTITPPPTTTTSTKIMTKTSLSLTKVFAITTQTVTATCTTPGLPGHPDKPCLYSPTRLHPAALATPTTIPKLHRFIRKADRAVDVEWARARIEAAKQRRTEMAREAAAPLERRAPDAPTLTVTADVPVNTTTTILAPATTTTETVLTSATVTSTLPPATVFSGLFTSTITLPTPTKTQLKLSFATTTKVITFGATFTKHTTVTPTTSVSACKKAGGHFW